MEQEQLPGVLTVDEVAVLAGLGRASVYAALEKGEMPGTRMGKLWRISRLRAQEHFGVGEEDVRRAVAAVAAKRAKARTSVSSGVRSDKAAA